MTQNRGRPGKVNSHLLEGSDRDSAEKMRQLCGAGAVNGVVLKIVKRKAALKRLLTKAMSPKGDQLESTLIEW